MPDTPVVPASCAAIHAATPSAPSGAYTIDPDGPAGAAAFMVQCDMTTDGGGWTVVFFATPNLTALPISYTAATPALLTTAQKVLIVYRDAAQAPAGNTATFDLPADWRAQAPFDYASTDAPVSVSINGAAPVSATLRYGSHSFNDHCTDAWDTTSWGRICITNTSAPYYTGFAVPDPDTCSTSTGGWNATTCSADLRFSIAVR